MLTRLKAGPVSSLWDAHGGLANILQMESVAGTPVLACASFGEQMAQFPYAHNLGIEPRPESTFVGTWVQVF